ncbi:hypothetical protein TruAng_012308 [Truncatella angustata]|nr:hypothetical protein TruAng_012308 [Truncatella angustata]
MSPLASRSLLRGATKLTSNISRRSISSFDKSPPSPIKRASEQAHPIGPYYESIIVNPQPIPDKKPEEPPTSSPKAPRSTAKKTAAAQDERQQPVNTSATPVPSLSAEPATAQEKARIIFGSPLAGPFERQERLRAIQDKSTNIAGVMVPPRPEEPDNCCMSGCVNCVWDRYRDDVEEWAALSKEAEKRLQADRAQGPVEVLGSVSAVKGIRDLKGPATVGSKIGSAPVNQVTSMDDGRGGSDTTWPVDQHKITKDLWDEDLYKGVPVGIREFMKTEKKLRKRHEEEESLGG